MTRKVPWLDPSSLEFPDPHTALKLPNGLLAVGGDLTVERLWQAYHLGIFPWYSDEQPILWWSPDPRMVLVPQQLRSNRSLRKAVRRSELQLTTDHAFSEVLRACAGPRAGTSGTWLSSDMQAAYLQLYQLGHAHSVEVWDHSNLVGGLYGVALPGIFFGESMFSRQPNASKFALAWLCDTLPRHGYQLIDCQVASAHLHSLGASEISRELFMQYLPKSLIPISCTSSWPVQ